MAIIQISKIQMRSGNLVDLPQLDEGEFGWASDEKRLFIGKEDPHENVEVLTGYSEISFSQIEGAVGNLNINPSSLANGQVLAFTGTEWVNKGGNAGGLITLGDVSNVKIDGGSIGYVLETDGLGNLSWTPKGTITSYILNASQTNPVVITTTEDNFFTQAAEVTITGAPGMTQLNGNSYYANVISSNSFSLYSDPSLTTPINGTGYGLFPNTTATATDSVTDRVTVGDSTAFALNSPVKFIGTTFGGIVENETYYVKSKPSGTTITLSLVPGGVTFELATATGTCTVYGTGGRVISSVGGVGVIPAAGTNTTVQFNNNGLLDGSPTFTFNNGTSTLNVTGTANIANLNVLNAISAPQFMSTVANGTAPFTANSSTLVANLNADLLDGYNSSIPAVVNTVVVRDSVGNINANGIVANLLSGILTTAAQPNVTSLGTLTGLVVNGNISAGNITSNGVFTGNGYNLTNLNPANISGTVANANFAANANYAAYAGNVTIAAQPNITSLGTLTSLNSSGNVTAPNIVANSGIFSGNGSGISAINASNITTGTLDQTRLANASITLNGTIVTLGGSYTVTANAGSSLTLGSYLTGGSYDGSAPITATVDATPNNTGSKVVARDANGSFSANIITANLSGMATTAGTVTTAAQPNITSVGNLTSLTVGNATNNTVISGGNVTTTGFITGNGVGIFSLNAGNIDSGTLNQARLANDSITINGTSIALGGSASIAAATAQTLTLGNYLTGISFNGSSAITTNVDATTTATGSKVVARDANANIYGNNLFGVIHPTSGTGTNGIVFPADPGGGSGDLATIQYYASVGESTILELRVTNDADDRILINATGGTNVTGTLTAGNFVGNGALLTAITGANVTGTVANATFATSTGTAATVTTNAQPNITSVGTLSSVDVTGNAAVGAIKTDNFYYANGTPVSFTGTYSNANVANYLPTYTGNFQAGNVSITGTYTGNGSGLSALNASNITSGTLDQSRLANSSITINGIAISLGSSGTITANAGATLTRGSYLTGNNYNGGTPETWAVDATSLNVGDKIVARDSNGSFSANIITATLNGTATTAGTVTTAAQPNITSVGTLSSLSVTGNTITGGIKTDGYYYANGAAVSFAGTYGNSNVANYLPTYNGNVGGGTATFYGTTLTTGANTTAGTVTGNWTLTAGSRWNATYADLAEWYCADQPYEPGTVLQFGGEQEVTIAGIETHRVAGVVSTEPAYVMNSDFSCKDNGVILALTGRVPVKVKGKIEKGDMLVSAGEGYAMASATPRIGTVIGKALNNFNGEQGVIEVVVGRL